MDDVVFEMVKKYRPKRYDWMRFKITRENPLTFHHLVKEADGGKKTIDNGALLTELAHRYLNQIERDSYPIYLEINKVLKEINKSGAKPTDEHKALIERILRKYESMYDSKLRQRIKRTRYDSSILLPCASGKLVFSPENIRKTMQQRGIDPQVTKVTHHHKYGNNGKVYKKRYKK